MSPTDVSINGQVVATVGPGNETRTLLPGVILTYYGDEYRGFGITENGEPVESGQIPTDLPIIAEVNRKPIPHPEKGQPPTFVGDRIKLVFRRGVEQ